MPRPFFLLPTALFAGALVLGCGEQPAPSEPASAPEPTLRTEHNPDGPGAQVSRFGFGGVFYSDPVLDMVLTVGAPLSDAPECGGTGSIIGGTGLDVLTPADVEYIAGRVRQGPMVVYGRFVEDLCDLTEADVIARGQGNTTLTILSRTPTLLIGFHAAGTVELTSGGLAHLVVAFQQHIDADGTMRVHTERFELKPIGG
jgi:hypothetical protein